MRLRPLVPFAAFAALSLGCGEPVEPRAPELSPADSAGPTVPVPSVTATEAPPPKVTTPVLPPLATDSRAPCDVAADQRKEADSLHAKGRSYKALRLVETADAQCPRTASSSWATRVDALSKIGRDTAAQALAKEILASASPDPAAATAARAAQAKTPPSSPPAADALLAQAITAQKSGAADARLQLDRAVVRFEQETAETPRPFLDIGSKDPLAISRDGATALFATGTLAVLYDLKELRPRRVFEQLKKKFETAAISADGKLLALGDDAGYVTLWSTATGKQQRRFSWASEDPGPLLFSADGKQLIVAGHTSFDTTVRFWNLETGDSADSFTISRGGAASALAQSRDGKTLVVGTAYGTVETWSVSPKKKLVTIAKKDSYADQVTSLVFSPKGDKIAGLRQDGKVVAWEAKTGKALWTVETQHTFSEPGIGFSADGSRVLGGSREGFSSALREWDATTGAELQNKPVDLTPALFSEDGKIAVGADRERTGILDLATATLKSIPRTESRLGAIEFGPPRTLAFALDGEKGLRVITPTTSRFFQTDDDHGPLHVSADGRMVARGSWREIRVFDVEKGTLVPGYPAPPETSPSIYFSATSGELRLLYGHFEERKLFSASPGDRAWKELSTFTRKGLDDLALSEYGQFFVAREDRKVLLVNPATGEARTVDDDPKERTEAAELSPDGRALFVVRAQRIARFDTETGKPTHGFSPLGCYSSRLSPSFDGSRVATQCSDRLQVFTFPKDSEAATTVALDLGRTRYDGFALAPHGDLVVTADDAGRLRLWDTKGTLRAEILAFPGTDAFLATTPTGRAFVAGQDRAKLDDRLFCRIGPQILPFVACEDAVLDDAVLRDAFAP